MSTQMLAVVKNGKIQILDSIDLPEGTELIVTIESNQESFEWSNLALQGLNRGYADDEPEYEVSQNSEIR
jgi:hypothetical protein